MDNKSISHTRWKCQYHIVFIPQYRKKVLYGKVREDVREILNTLCKPNSTQEVVQVDNKSISHTRWKCQYHIVFIPQYRKKVLYGKVREDVREILNTLCKYKNVEIIAGAVCVDHVHLSVAIPPKLSVSDFMGYLKGKSTLMLYDRHPELQSKWDKAFWARGYYVETIGNITDEAVQKYIKEQAEESRKEDSRSTAL